MSYATKVPPIDTCPDLLKGVQAALDTQIEANLKLQEEVADLERSFELRHGADVRAIARWREAHLGKELVMPDQADLCVWLMEQLEKKP